MAASLCRRCVNVQLITRDLVSLDYIKVHNLSVLHKSTLVPGLSTTETCPHDHSTPARHKAQGQTPPGPKSLPFIGTMYKYLPYIGSYSMKNQQKTDTLRYKKYGTVVREEVMPGQVMYYIYDPALFSEVFSQESKYPSRFAMEGVKAYRESRNQHPGFPNSEGEVWYKIRQPTNQLMLRPKSVSAYTQIQNVIAKEMVDVMRMRRDDEQEVANLSDILYRFGMESIGRVIFDTRLGTLSVEETPGSEVERFVSAVNDAFHTMYDTTFFWPLHKHKNTNVWHKLEESFDYISNMTEKCMDECVQRMQQRKGEENNFLHSLLSNPNLDSKQILAMICDLFYAGVDTVAHSIAFNMYHLARYPDVQENLYDEISTNVSSEQEITYEILNKMTYLKAVIKETFRLTPVSAFGVARRFEKDLTVGGYHISAGSFVFLQPNVLARSPNYFPEPDEFRPERWLLGNVANTTSYPMMPFGYGGRMCAGKRFAQQEIQLGLINMLQTFRLEYHHKDIGMETKFLNQPNKPLRFTLLDRS